MKNTFGNSITVTVFGESHGEAVGAVIDGFPPGITIDDTYISEKMDLRRAYGSISTGRREDDKVKIVSGVLNGKTTGTPICIIIGNNDVDSSDYLNQSHLARPGHADYTAFCKYHGFEDQRGGGHFSGRLTAPLTAAGAIALYALESRGIYIGSHIKKCGGVEDAALSFNIDEIKELNQKRFAVLNDTAGEKMRTVIESAAAEGDSVGGVIETEILGLPAGVGEPWFDSVESLISHIVFSVPAVKGIEFGAGFAFADMKGSISNDPFCLDNGKIITSSNNNGGINGGITNGMPVVFRTVIKPTPSISKPQSTVDFYDNTEEEIRIHGRHDPSIVHRARVVIDSLAAVAVCDLLCLRFGTDFLAENK